MSDWVYDNSGWCLVGLAGLIFALLAFANMSDSARRSRFMDECLTERKQYECTAMWRSSQGTVTPMPIVIPMR